ncbi:serine/threonine-protein kinase [Streptomyces phaeochromogenes]|uniref:serine/threonine-protein kinase n=1 Tax=Streptomyces phaeochromogenes TaxID=1923 RepID=UPI0022573D85|nr:serine/threonine-protein kinase [Streptomyces phaeochromogenes]MCX5603894.1 serine/threonine-protein kinase [Streptomyces phaeochromogenes]
MPDQRPTSPYSPESGDAALEQAGASRLQPKDPARIGPYVSLGLLGKGGMGRVYLARPADDSPGLAAVKVIRPEYAEDAGFRRRFEREAAVHGQVRTPHAPQLLGTGFQDELLWMATQYVPGLNLAEAIRACGGLEPASMWRLVGELGQALSALAAAGIVHRDLKPSNVILSTWGAHVIDFGISQAADSSAITTTGSRVGTPAFMSPEYLREGRCDTASDVFSLASTLVYAATARAPFGDGTGVDVMHRVAFEEPRSEIMDDLAEADPPLAALLLACLSKDPAGRPTPQQLIDAAPTHPRTSCGPHEPRESHEPTWQEPLGSLLLARRAAHEVLGHTSAEQMGHFHAPAERAASPGPAPAPVPAFGPPPATPVSPYSASTPVPAPPPGFGPAMATADSTPTAGPSADSPSAGSPVPGAPPAPAPDAARSTPATRGRKPYFVVTAVLAVCAVAVSAFLLTRPGTTGTASPAPTTERTASEELENSPSPDSSGPAFPSPSREEKEKTDDKNGGSKGDASGAGGGGDGGQVEPTRAETTAADDSGGSGGGSGDDGSGSEPAPTRTTAEPATPPWISQCTYYSGTQLTQSGDRGQRVVQVQCMLDKRGYGVGGAGVDGQFGKDTASAVKAFQSDKGLEVDGQVGPNTWASLRGST